ncbi:hypothetical protein QEG73_22880 [Chitinophagaceae bacterium 26-R-25]|nr:hypothetical protein [Chitinophagaceae bacterium 26-R-25]
MSAGLRNDPFHKQIVVGGIPPFVVIDKDGKMINAKCGMRPSNPLLKTYLTELINKNQ